MPTTTDHSATDPAGIAALRMRLESVRDDRARLPLLLALAERLAAIDPEEGIAVAEEADDIADRLGRPEERAHALRQIGRASLYLHDLSGALRAYRKALALLRERSDASTRIERAELSIEIGRLETERREYGRGVEFYREGLALFEECGDANGMILALKGMGDLYVAIGEPREGLDRYFQALALAEESDDRQMAGVSLSDIGLVYSALKETDRALTYFERARTLFAAAGLTALEVRALANMANLHAAARNYDTALDYALRAMAIYDALGDGGGLAATLANLSTIYQERDEVDAALECCRKAFALFEELEDREGCCTTLINTGILYQRTDQQQEALYVYERGLEIARELDEPRLEQLCHNHLSATLEAIGDTARSLKHLRAYTALRERIEGEERLAGIAELEAKHELERSEREREILRLRGEQLELENRHKSGELTSLSMRLVEKSRFINDLRLTIEKIAADLPEQAQPPLRDMLRRIKQNSSGADDWRAFEQQFRDVHHDFTTRLSQRYPTLTSAELKVCALIRAGLSSGEIADLFHVTKRNIDTHRYRLRKKLGIAQSVDLGVFLAGM